MDFILLFDLPFIVVTLLLSSLLFNHLVFAFSYIVNEVMNLSNAHGESTRYGWIGNAASVCLTLLARSICVLSHAW